MSDIVRIREKYYVLSTSSLADQETRSLKHGDTFAVFDKHGDIHPVGMGSQGLYHDGTRYVSRFSFSVEEKRPFLLSSMVREENEFFHVDFSNPDLSRNGETYLDRGSIHISRSIFLYEKTCYQRFQIKNFHLGSIHSRFVFEFDSDFADLFEVRGVKRSRKGTRMQSLLESSAVTLRYKGLDQVIRRAHIQFSCAPDEITSTKAGFEIRLGPREETTLFIAMTCLEDKKTVVSSTSFDGAYGRLKKAQRLRKERTCDIYTANENLNNWLSRSMADIHMMITDTKHGPYPYAGVPWFNTCFGRDGIITAFECLWFAPEMARGVLGYLAETQAEEENPAQDAQPGKILHETRKGEMANLGEIPFKRYYGSVDATPLFIMLAGNFLRRTGDINFVRHLWPSVEKALNWIDRYGDRDGDGFVEYERSTDKGLVNQGWKDSGDAIFHQDGRLAKGPIALCEVQGYVYAAWNAASKLAESLGKNEVSKNLAVRARALRQKFNEQFWCDELSAYALALDGDKKQCKVKSSNTGHCLFSGIATDERAQRVADMLIKDDMFSGWGIRTLSAAEKRYNPMAYHNGSIWPHDNAIIAHGLARYGFKQHVLKILTGLFDASIFLEINRLPELFCGFSRRPGEGPTLYPVACSPQAWAAGSVFWLLKSCLGMSVSGQEGKIYFNNPILPESIQDVQIKNLLVGKTSSVDLSFKRHEKDVGVIVTRRQGDVEVVAVK